MKEKILVLTFILFGMSMTSNAQQIYMCQSCPAGSYSIKGDPTCTKCLKSTASVSGTYQNVGGQKTCLTIGNGYYAATEGAVSQTICPAGNKCPSGKIIACGAGKSSEQGAIDCTACPKGTYKVN